MTRATYYWHSRYTHQARWTRDLRHYLYERAGLGRAARVLDVGCGTGVLSSELAQSTTAAVHGLDLNPAALALAVAHAPGAEFTCADAHGMPYPSGVFDICLCHFLLLWVEDPGLVVAEMARVTRPRGAVLALAEPDYGGRIDYPAELARLGEWQQASLRRQGADPLAGRQLAKFFSEAGLEDRENGVLGGQWSGTPSQAEWESEWEVLAEDIKQISPVSEDRDPAEWLERLKKLDAQAWTRGDRVLYVPTFYAWGRVPS